jgi:DnaD/phage-associated family protein
MSAHDAPYGGFTAATFPLYTSLITDLLAQIDHLGELRVTLYALWAVRQREGASRYLLLRDFTHAALMPTPADLDDALSRACVRGTLLSQAAGGEMLYFVNDDAGRAAAQQVRAGAWRSQNNAAAPVEILPPRPSIYVLYEQNIGALTPMIRDELLAASHDFPAGWLEEAIRLAVTGNKRNWRYIRAILDRWQKEGKSHETAPRSAAEPERRLSRDPSDFIIR